jgi:hypothetical protein
MIATRSSIRSAHSAQPESVIKDNAPIALADSAGQARAYERTSVAAEWMAAQKRTATKQKSDLRGERQTKREV